jgi:hypothetical protein
MVVRAGLVAASFGLVVGCASARPEAKPVATAPTMALVYVVGNAGSLERRDDVTLDWVAACAGTCGQYIPASGTYRVRGAVATSAPFALPPPDLDRVILRFDDDGHVWTHVTPRALRQPQPFMPSLVLFLR